MVAMSAQDYVQALENIKGAVEEEDRILAEQYTVEHPVRDAYKFILAEIGRVVPDDKPGRHALCGVCNHTPLHCSC